MNTMHKAVTSRLNTKMVRFSFSTCHSTKSSIVLMISIAGKACEYCQRLFSWNSKVSKKDIRDGRRQLESGANSSLTLNYMEHLENCKHSRVGQQVYPEKGEVLRFKRPETLHHHPMTLYLDFETSNRSLAMVSHSLFIFFNI